MIKVGRITEEMRIRTYAFGTLLLAAVIVAIVNWDTPTGSAWLFASIGAVALAFIGTCFDLRSAAHAKPVSELASVRFGKPWFQGVVIAVVFALIAPLNVSIFPGDSGAEIASMSILVIAFSGALGVALLVAERKLREKEEATGVLAVRRISGTTWKDGPQRGVRSVTAAAAAKAP